MRCALIRKSCVFINPLNGTPLQIAKDLYHFFPKVGIATLKLPGDGLCFKFDPIHSFPGTSMSTGVVRDCTLLLCVCTMSQSTFPACSLSFSHFAEQSTSIEDVDAFVDALKQKVVSF